MVNLFPLLPTTIAILFPLKVVLVTSLAIYYGHVKPLFPYISDSGTTHPEAAWFCLFLSFESTLVIIFHWIRYKQIRYICANFSDPNSNEIDNKRVLNWNKYGLYLSVVSALSMASVGAFRATEHFFIHHLTAFVTFGGFWIEFFLQTRISFKLVPNVNTLAMARFRLIATIFLYIFTIMSFLGILVSILQTSYSHYQSMARLWWDESGDGYVAHVISAVSEHIVIMMASPFYGSFITEFNRIHSHNGKLKYKFLDSNTENIKIKTIGRQSKP